MTCPNYDYTSPIFYSFTLRTSRRKILHELVENKVISRTVIQIIILFKQAEIELVEGQLKVPTYFYKVYPFLQN